MMMDDWWALNYNGDFDNEVMKSMMPPPDRELDEDYEDTKNRDREHWHVHH